MGGRAHKGEPVQVETSAEGNLEPHFLTLGGKRYPVVEIVDRWHPPKTGETQPGEARALYFKVNASNGHQYILRYDPESGGWSIVKTFPGDA